jgi:hypothetical protein
MMLMVDDQRTGARTPLSSHGRTITGTQEEMEQAASWLPDLHPEVVPHDGTSPLAFISWLVLQVEATEQGRWEEFAQDHHGDG